MNMLQRMASGQTPGEISTELHITEKDVHNWRQRVRTILGAKTDAHAVAIAYERGLLRTYRQIQEGRR